MQNFQKMNEKMQNRNSFKKSYLFQIFPKSIER